jgi:acetyltransferase-like isoleucine patch superfamily enzyme
MSLLQRSVKLVRSPWQDKINRAHSFFVGLKTAVYYRHLFAEIGKGSLLYKPRLLSGPQFVHIGAGTLIRGGARIEAILIDPERPPRIEIGSNVNIEQNVHIVCTSSIRIGNNVSITGNCSITDTTHPFLDVENPVKIGARIDPTPAPVEIGDDTFMGIGCVVLPGVRIGKSCVLGANSTVTRDIPDYSVAAGNPSRILRRYDFPSRSWIKSDSGEAGNAVVPGN